LKLSRYTDYALRVLMYLGVRDDHRCSIREISSAYRISENHLMKVVQDLARLGYVQTIRGRGGGLHLALPASQITIGEVVRHTETDMGLADCGSCTLAGVCPLTAALAEAVRALLQVLDKVTLADAIGSKAALVRRLGLPDSPPTANA